MPSIPPEFITATARDFSELGNQFAINKYSEGYNTLWNTPQQICHKKQIEINWYLSSHGERQRECGKRKSYHKGTPSSQRNTRDESGTKSAGQRTPKYLAAYITRN
jgi:hypothetical protein